MTSFRDRLIFASRECIEKLDLFDREAKRSFGMLTCTRRWGHLMNEKIRYAGIVTLIVTMLICVEYVRQAD